MALDQSALLGVLEALKAAEVEGNIRLAAETSSRCPDAVSATTTVCPANPSGWPGR
jgi:hypothetical protein